MLWIAEVNIQTKADSVYDVLVQMGVGLLPRMLWAIAILALTRFLIGTIQPVTRRLLTPMEPTIRKFFVQALELLTLIAGLVAALNMLGIETTTVIAVLGAAGLAIGLALQNTLSHFAAGVMLVSFRPFEVGDFIEGAGVSGLVDAIGIFSTTIITLDNVKIIVPNNNLFSGNLKNTTALDTRRVDIEINIGDRPIQANLDQFLAAIQAHPLVLKNPKPICQVGSLVLEGTVIQVRPWCATAVYDQVKAEIQQLIKESLVD
jgi:small conductance mechanosensitive channel